MKKTIKQEYPFHRTSIKALWIALTSPAQLSEWFAEKVDLTDNKTYVFYWDNIPNEAKVIRSVKNEEIIFQWKGRDAEDMFIFRCFKSELTGDVTLEITDTCEESDYEMTQKVWESQIEALQRIIGK